MAKRVYWKVLEGTSAPVGRWDYSDYLPKGRTPGRATPTVSTPVLCVRGWHAWKYAGSAIHMGLSTRRMFLAEVRGICDTGISKVVGKRIRLLREVPASVLKRADDEESRSDGYGSGSKVLIQWAKRQRSLGAIKVE